MQYFQYNLFVQEELRTAVEAEVLDAAGEVDIAGEDAEALHGTYVAKVDDYLVWQRLHILAPSRVPVGRLVTINHSIGNAFTKLLGIGKHYVPLVLVYRVAVFVKKLNLADARVFVVICCLHVNTQVTQCLHTIEGKLLPTGLVLDSSFEDTVILIEDGHTVIVARCLECILVGAEHVEDWFVNAAECALAGIFHLKDYNLVLALLEPRSGQIHCLLWTNAPELAE